MTRRTVEPKWRMLAECVCNSCGKEFMQFTDMNIKCPDCKSKDFKILSEYPKDPIYLGMKIDKDAE